MIVRSRLLYRRNIPGRHRFTTLSLPEATRLLNSRISDDSRNGRPLWQHTRKKILSPTAFRIRIDRDIKAAKFEIEETIGQRNHYDTLRPGLPGQKMASTTLTWSHDTLPAELLTQVSSLLSFSTNAQQRTQLSTALNALWQTFKKYEAEEIHFWVETSVQDISFNLQSMLVDTDAMRRQPEIAAMKKADKLTALERQAEADGLIYTQLDGNIGCIVNGAGLAMATNDVLSHFGGKAANFLDTGGQATTDLLVKAFALLISDRRTTAILVNIFGGLIRCDMIAESVIRAAKELDLQGVPVVVRLRGTNQEIGQKMIAESGLPLHPEHQIDGAAKRVIQLARKSTGRPATKVPAGARHFSSQRIMRQDRRAKLLNFDLDADTKVIYQGFTGKVATSNAQATMSYGTNVVGGVSPGKGGTTHLDRPVFNTVQDAMDELRPDVSAIFVPALQAKKAILESIAAKVPLIVSVAEGIPLHDMLHVHEALRESGQSKLIGPNCPGIINANTKVRVGIMPYAQFSPGSIAIISKSGTLSYEAVGETTKHGLGQSTVLGIGGDMLPGTSMVDALSAILPREDTKGIILIGEIGGIMEIEAAVWLKNNNSTNKPIVSMIAGHTAPDNKVMGHAGALRRPGDLTAAEKSDALRDAGVVVVQYTAQLATTMKDLLSKT